MIYFKMADTATKYENTTLSAQDLRSPSRMSATLGFDAYADILASTISTLDTPANVGIFAGWGCGKSYLLHKIKDTLHERSRQYSTTNGRFFACTLMLLRLIFYDPPLALKKSNEVRFISAYFNALEYAGSDHLWAGLVTKLVGAVEGGIGRLPSAIFRAKPPRRMGLHCSISSNPKHLRFRPVVLCGSKVPIYSLFIFVIISCVGIGIGLLTFSFNQQTAIREEYKRDHNGTTIEEAELSGNSTIPPLAIGSIVISIPFIAFLKSAIPVITKVIHTHSAQIQKMVKKPDFSKELGVMAKIKGEIKLISRLVRFMELFEQRRIVIAIFIDDLDKLPQQNIAPLLQAIKILLSDQFSRFVSIIAIDPYSVSDALEMGIQSEFPAINISGHNFLKQMIQVPFCIPAMNLEEKTHLYSMLVDRDRLSKVEVSSNLKIMHADGVDSKVDKNLNRQHVLSIDSPESDTGPLLVNNTKMSTAGDILLSIPVKKDNNMKNVPLEEHTSVISACDNVMSELANPKIFLFMKNNFQEMKRIVGIVKVTTRVVFCRLDKAKTSNPDSRFDIEEPIGILPYNLAAWVVLVGQWPYRMTWIVQQVEDREDAHSPYDATVSLFDVYRDAERNFTLVSGWRKLIQLDGDPDHMVAFLNSNSDWLNIAFLEKLMPHTISLDRSLKSIVAWTSVERDLKTQGVLPSKSLAHMNVDDVISLIKAACKGSKRIVEYAEKCTEHNLNGAVLLRGDLEEIKKCIGMTLGDWTQFSHALLQLKTVHNFKFRS